MTVHVRVAALTAVPLPLTRLRAPSRERAGSHVRREATQADALALVDAGLMPLSHYMDLAERNGWVTAKV